MYSVFHCCFLKHIQNIVQRYCSHIVDHHPCGHARSSETYLGMWDRVLDMQGRETRMQVILAPIKARALGSNPMRVISASMQLSDTPMHAM